MSAEIRAWLEDYKREVRREGLEEGRVEGERRLLLRLLRARFGELLPPVVARVEAGEMADIERWGERLLDARMLADVFDDPRSS